jgi:hypothetical protein
MSNVVGTWNLTTDWGCDGSITGSFDQVFNADGTWTVAGHRAGVPGLAAKGGKSHDPLTGR